MSYKELSAVELLKYFSGTIFQTFYDPDSTKGKASWFTSYNEKDFKALNSKKFGIYFSVNSFKERRVKENVTKLQALFGDFDLAKDGDSQSREQITEKKQALFKQLTALAIKPNIIIITKNGLQPLWLIQDPGLSPEILDKYVATLNGLIAWSVEQGALGDKVKDWTRVLRVPGYFHHKSDPFIVKAFLIHEAKTTLEEMHKAFPYFDTERIVNDNATKDGTNSLLDSVSIKDVALAALKEYGEPDAYFDSKGRIVLERGVTGAFLGKLDHADFIGSHSHELPAGNKITFVRRLLKLADNKAAFLWIVKTFNLKLDNTDQPDAPQEIDYAAQWRSEKANKRTVIKSGFPALDASTGGFEGGRFYVLAGLEKSGKTTYELNIINNILNSGEKVGYLDTELGVTDFFRRAASIYYSMHEKDARLTTELVEQWVHKFVDTGKLQYSDEAMIHSNGVPNTKLTQQLFTKMIDNGAKVVVLDNLTTIMQEAPSNVDGWKFMSGFTLPLIKYAQQKGIVLIFVLHTKGKELIESLATARVSKLLEDNQPEMIFEKLKTFNHPPDKSKLYGGMGLSSQISGGIIFLWRPFQDFEESDYYSMGEVILESFRSRTVNFKNRIRVYFDENTSQYTELGDIPHQPEPAEPEPAESQTAEEPPILEPEEEPSSPTETVLEFDANQPIPEEYLETRSGKQTPASIGIKLGYNKLPASPIPGVSDVLEQLKGKGSHES